MLINMLISYIFWKNVFFTIAAQYDHNNRYTCGWMSSVCLAWNPYCECHEPIFIGFTFHFLNSCSFFQKVHHYGNSGWTPNLPLCSMFRLYRNNILNTKRSVCLVSCKNASSYPQDTDNEKWWLELSLLWKEQRDRKHGQRDRYDI